MISKWAVIQVATQSLTERNSGAEPCDAPSCWCRSSWADWSNPAQGYGASQGSPRDASREEAADPRLRYVTSLGLFCVGLLN